jgi:hypothetical protein
MLLDLASSLLLEYESTLCTLVLDQVDILLASIHTIIPS